MDYEDKRKSKKAKNKSVGTNRTMLLKNIDTTLVLLTIFQSGSFSLMATCRKSPISVNVSNNLSSKPKPSSGMK